MVVDGTVVMVENIVRHLGRREVDGRSPKQKIFEAAHEVQRPVFYAIGIIITAYLPIFTLQRVEGQLLKPMAWTVAFALLGALMFSMLVAPVLSSFFFARGAGAGTYQPSIILAASRGGASPRRGHWTYQTATPVALPGQPALPPPPTLSGMAAPTRFSTLSGIPSATPPVVPVYHPPHRRRRPLSFKVPTVPVGGIDPAILVLLLEEAKEQGAEDALLLALLKQLQNGANFGPAVSGMGLDLGSLLKGAGVKLDAAGLPVPGGYMGTDQSGADLYADGGVDPTGGALGDYTDPRSQ